MRKVVCCGKAARTNTVVARRDKKSHTCRNPIVDVVFLPELSQVYSCQYWTEQISIMGRKVRHRFPQHECRRRDPIQR